MEDTHARALADEHEDTHARAYPIGIIQTFYHFVFDFPPSCQIAHYAVESVFVHEYATQVERPSVCAKSHIHLTWFDLYTQGYVYIHVYVCMRGCLCVRVHV